MRFATHWARAEAVFVGADGRSFPVEALGWSDESEADAARMAQERAARAAARLEAGGARERYGYLDRPMREPILEVLQGSAESPVTVVTRNRYGAEVLNSATAFFIDVDAPEPDLQARPGCLGGLFGTRAGGEQASSLEARTVQALEGLVRDDPALGFRIYRTAGGLRVLAVNGGFDPLAEDTRRIMELVGADPLYIRLCQAQECFRARLTPKPWRCGVEVNPVAHPRELGDRRRDFEGWLKRYEQARRAHRTCAYLRTVGRAEVAPELRVVVDHHDRSTGCDEERPLA